MTSRTAIGLWLGLAVSMPTLSHAGEDAYGREIELWRTERVRRLTAPDGWLSLIGLHFLATGENTIGAAKDNAIVLGNGPAHAGSVTLAVDGRVTVALRPSADGRIDGRPTMVANLLFGGGGKPTVVSFGTVSFFVVERGGKMALRVKDSAADRRVHFAGIDYFPIDPAWRIEAVWEPFDQPRELQISDLSGQISTAIVLGAAVFEHEGKKLALLPIEDEPGGPLFFVISDATNGHQTYSAARFLYADPPENGKVVLDFNRMENPPCAFTPFATCPLPPSENRLPFAVAAGEKVYRNTLD